MKRSMLFMALILCMNPMLGYTAQSQHQGDWGQSQRQKIPKPSPPPKKDRGARPPPKRPQPANVTNRNNNHLEQQQQQQQRQGQQQSSVNNNRNSVRNDVTIETWNRMTNNLDIAVEGSDSSSESTSFAVSGPSTSEVHGSGNSDVDIEFNSPKPLPGTPSAIAPEMPNQPVIATKGQELILDRTARMRRLMEMCSPAAGDHMEYEDVQGRTGVNNTQWFIVGPKKGDKVSTIIPLAIRDPRMRQTGVFRCLAFSHTIGRARKVDESNVFASTFDARDTAEKIRKNGKLRGSTVAYHLSIPCLDRSDEATVSTGISGGGNAGSATANGSTVNAIAGAFGLGHGTTVQGERSVTVDIILIPADPKDLGAYTLREFWETDVEAWK